ncbi:MarR family winged helix-turn-helix transcriptional regulator [Nocardia sp. NPDC004860]|uniref:MarR family winged helix-turn-helix transcriptional regulator n=1 Tax=Nocardia sp. NPDC004860 TaxID=3154557 RepID=UPI0033B9CEBF
MRSDEPGEDEVALLENVGIALYQLRHRTVHTPTSTTVTRRDLVRDLVVDIVDRAAGTATINDVAEQLLVTPSIARRLVTECIYRDLVLRVPADHDRRRYSLHLTEAGIALRDRLRRHYRQAFEHVTRDWPADERLEFARLLHKYAAP